VWIVSLVISYNLLFILILFNLITLGRNRYYLIKIIRRFLLLKETTFVTITYRK